MSRPLLLIVAFGGLVLFGNVSITKAAHRKCDYGYSISNYAASGSYDRLPRYDYYYSRPYYYSTPYYGHYHPGFRFSYGLGGHDYGHQGGYHGFHHGGHHGGHHGRSHHGRHR